MLDRCYTISEFASAFGMDRSTAKYRLTNLAKAGVISVKRVGPLYIYCPPSGDVLTSEMARRVVKTAAKNLRSILTTARGWPSISTSDLLGSDAPSVWRGFIKELISWILASEDEEDCVERGREIICPRRVWEEVLQKLEEGKIVV